jgi:hypothetical protein
LRVSSIWEIAQLWLCTYLNGSLLAAAREYVLHGLDRGLNRTLASSLSQVYSCLLRPTQHLAVCSNGSCFTLNLFLAHRRPNTNVQVNNTLALHHVQTDTQIYITSILLFIFFLTPLPLHLAGRLPLTLPVGHNTYIEGSDSR